MTRLRKSTRYALYASMEMARLEPRGQVTAAQVAERHRIPPSVLAKVFQQLVRAGIAHGVRGSRGGYRLARVPTAITVLDVMEAFEPARKPGHCLLEAEGHDECEEPVELEECCLRRLFDEVDEQARSTFASVTLETLVGRPRPGMGPKPTSASEIDVVMAGRPPTETST
jgi:Rrf2 family protein